MKKQTVRGSSKTPETTAPARIAIRQLRYSSLAIFLAGEAAIVVGTLVFFFNRGLDSMIIFIGFACTTLFFLVFTILTYYYAKNIWTRVLISEDRLLSISNMSTGAILSVDADFIITAWSKGAEQVFGYTPKEAVGSSIALILSDDFFQHDADAIANLLDEGVIQQHRTYRKRKDGEVIPVDLSASTLMSPDGRATGFLIAMQDIRNLVEMEGQLRASADRLEESKRRYKNLFETSIDGLLFLDLKGNILQCNQAYADLLGYRCYRLEGMSYHEVTPPEWSAVDDDIFNNQVLKTGRSDEYMKEFARNDGTTVPVLIRAWLARDSDDNPLGIWVIVRDISERKQYEDFIRETIVRLDDAYEQLRETDRLKTEFVAMVSHELRAPLAAIQTGLDTLMDLRQGGGSKDEVELLEVLGRGVYRLSHLVNDLMEITRIDTGKLTLDVEPADASDIISRVVALYQRSYNEKGLALKTEHPDGPCPLLCDPRRVEQVLTNLVDNALKFTEEGEVIVRLECTPNRVICSVSDTGSGISPDLHQKIFDKFYSSGFLTNSEQQGIGLGLAISKGIIKAHGGSIWVESHDNSGVTFTFDLPREPSEDMSS